MAQVKMFYPGLSNSLRYLRVQVMDSLPWTVQNLPQFNSCEEIFKFCKSKFKYEKDPEITELFMTVPTLFENNKHGESGAGDCDDATILCLSLLILSGFDCGIVLAGRSKDKPSHIYAYGLQDGEKKLLDLTTNKFNREGGTRDYTHRQSIPFKISKNQRDMFLELADGGHPFKQHPKKMRIRKLTPSEHSESYFMPSGNFHLPIDRLDKMKIRTAKQTLLGEGYTTEQLSEYLSGRAERKARKKEKAQFKTAKRKAKIEKKSAKTEKIRAKASKKRDTGKAKILRGQAKQIKAAKGGGSGAAFGREFIKGAGGLISKFKQGGGEEEAEEVNPFDVENVEPGEEGDTFDITQFQQPQEQEEQSQEEEQPQEEETTEEEMELQDGKDYSLISGIAFVAGIFLERRSA